MWMSKWGCARSDDEVASKRKPAVEIRVIRETKEGHHLTQKFVDGKPVGREVAIISTPSSTGYFNNQK